MHHDSSRQTILIYLTVKCRHHRPLLPTRPTHESQPNGNHPAPYHPTYSRAEFRKRVWSCGVLCVVARDGAAHAVLSKQQGSHTGAAVTSESCTELGIALLYHGTQRSIMHHIQNLGFRLLSRVLSRRRDFIGQLRTYLQTYNHKSYTTTDRGARLPHISTRATHRRYDASSQDPQNPQSFTRTGIR